MPYSPPSRSHHFYHLDHHHNWILLNHCLLESSLIIISSSPYSPSSRSHRLHHHSLHLRLHHQIFFQTIFQTSFIIFYIIAIFNSWQTCSLVHYMFASLNLSLSSKKYEDIMLKILADSHWRGLEPSYVLRHQLKGGQVVSLFLSINSFSQCAFKKIKNKIQIMNVNS